MTKSSSIEPCLRRCSRARRPRGVSPHALTDDGIAARDILLLRLRALLARAHGDESAYADFRDAYRDMVKTLGYEGHIAWAEAMP